jgi:anti-sigma factor RsiW
VNCSELKHDLYGYLERQLPDERRAELEAHAAACPACAEIVRIAGEITCREVAEFLHEYVDGELEGMRRAVFERHMRLCPPCVDFLHSYKRTMELAGEAWSPCDDDNAPEVPDEVVRAILAARAREQPGGAG